jgi:hypothetical protein
MPAKDERVGLGGPRSPSVAAWFVMTTAPEGVRRLSSRPRLGRTPEPTGYALPGDLATSNGPVRYYVVEHDPRFGDPSFNPFEAAQEGFDYIDCGDLLKACGGGSPRRKGAKLTFDWSGSATVDAPEVVGCRRRCLGSCRRGSHLQLNLWLSDTGDRDVYAAGLELLPTVAGTDR